jgi:copper(I)-binding protein
MKRSTRSHAATGVLALALAAVVGLAAAAQAAGAPKIRIEKVWARPGVATAMKPGATPSGGMHGGGGMKVTSGTSAIYMVIHNDGPLADRLIGAVTDVTRTVELHQTKLEGGMAQMMPVAGIDVPAKGMVELKPGGLHVMLIGLKRDLKAGDRFPVTLKFQKSGEVKLTVGVRAP